VAMVQAYNVKLKCSCIIGLMLIHRTNVNQNHYRSNKVSPFVVCTIMHAHMRKMKHHNHNVVHENTQRQSIVEHTIQAIAVHNH